MATRFRTFRGQFDAWYNARPRPVQKALYAAYAVAVWALIITVIAAVTIESGMSAQQSLRAPIWIQVVLWTVGAALVIALGAWLVVLARAVVASALGDGDERKGWMRLGISAVVLFLGLKAVHMAAFAAWGMTPLASQRNEVAARYSDMCTVQVQDGENSSHTEEDWHAGADVCAPLKRRLDALYPSPAWLFGARPADD